MRRIRHQGKDGVGFNTRRKLQPKVGRKPFGDLTNSTKPHAKVGSPKKICNEVQIHSDIAQEGFCHNHQECIKGQSQCMRMDYFLETVGGQKEASVSVASPNLQAPSTASKFKLETPVKYPEGDIDLDT